MFGRGFAPSKHLYFDDFYINFAKNLPKIFENPCIFANLTHSVSIIISPFCIFQTSKQTLMHIMEFYSLIAATGDWKHLYFDEFYINFAKNLPKFLKNPPIFANLTHSVSIIIFPLCKSVSHQNQKFLSRQLLLNGWMD